MAHDESIVKELTEKFGLPADKIRIARERRIFAEVDYGKFFEIFEHAVKKLEFIILCTITGQDEGEKITAIYHLARPDGTVLNLKTGVPRSNPTMKTVGEFFPGGQIYERELVDMFGVRMEGLPPGNRYPLPENWPDGQYPLRKDWKPEMLEPKSAPAGE